MSIRVSMAIVTAVGMASLSSDLLAHEGHGNPQRYDSFLHYLTEPMHLPLVLAGLITLVVVVRRLFRRPARRPAARSVLKRIDVSR